jgi:hypothetical protein
VRDWSPWTRVGMAAVLLAGLSACGTGRDDAAAAGGGGAGKPCPLTADEVRAAVGVPVPPAQQPAGAMVVCTFTKDSGQLPFAVPSVNVQPFPLADQPAKTLPELRAALQAQAKQMTAKQRDTTIGEIVDQPGWGAGAFQQITRLPASEVAPVPFTRIEDWLPSYHITVVVPDNYAGITADARTIGTAIGDKAK